MSPGEVAWDFDIPLVTNRFIVWDVAKIIVLAPLLMLVLAGSMILALDGSWGEVVALVPVVGLAVVILAALFFLVMLLVYRNRFPSRFAVDAREARFEVTVGQRRANTLVTVLGLLAGRPSMTGAGLLAKAQEQVSVAWRDVWRVKLYPGERVVVLRNRWRVVLRLHCTPENYDDVARISQAGFEASADARAAGFAARVAARRDTYRGWWPWVPQTVVSTVLATASPVAETSTPFWILGGLVLLGAVTAGGLRRFLGILSLAVGVGVVFWIVSALQETHSFAAGLIVTTEFESVTRGDDLPFFIISIVGLADLLAVAARNALTRRG